MESKSNFCNLLNVAVKESFFTFNIRFYIQVDAFTVGCPLGPILPNICYFHHENTSLMNVL